MKVTILGAGAIGSLIGARLGRTGAAVTLLARGAHLAAIRSGGLRIQSDDRESVHRLPATDDPRALGPQDLVVSTLKAHQGAGALDCLTAMLGPETAVVTAQNGFPWWYFHGIEHPLKETPLESVDPGRRQWHAIGPERAIGATVYPAAALVAPGVVRHLSGDAFGLGEAAGGRTARLELLGALFAAAGFKPTLHVDIRVDLWPKLWGTIAFNPISALTRARLDVITSDPGTRGLALTMMREAEAIALALGAKPNLSVEGRLAKAEQVGAHKTSMLQDLEAGRPLELEATLGAMAELARHLKLPTPSIDAVLALVRQLDRTRPPKP